MSNYRLLRSFGAKSLVSGLMAILLMHGALAAFPEKPITLVVPFAPGGSSDNIARTLAPMLSEKLGQPVAVENVSGAGGVLGTQKVVRSSSDGYTVLLGSGSEILINKLINPSISYVAARDLSPVAFVGTGPMVVLGKPSLPANTIPELTQYLKSKPGSLSYGSAGNGTPMHVAGELFKMRAGVFMTHIPYRGASPALTDLMGGQIDVAISTLSAANAAIKAGRVKVLAVTSSDPSELAPTIPAMGKQPNLKGFDLNVWFGLFVPASTPVDVKNKLQAAAMQVISDQATRARLADQGVIALGETGASLSKFMTSETEKYRTVVKVANMKPE